MGSKLYLCEFTLSVSTYMNDDEREEKYSRIVRADSPEEARAILEASDDFKTEEYSIYRNIIDFEANGVIE